MKITIEIAKRCKKWDLHKDLNKALMAKIVKNIIHRFPNFKLVKRFELSILLTDDKQMQELNSTFCQKEKTTNVLSFPDIELKREELLEFKPNIDYMYLGDIAFGYQVIILESIERNVSFENHFFHLFVHSILHLIGFDHNDDAEAKHMEEMEVNILNDFAISSPYN